MPTLERILELRTNRPIANLESHVKNVPQAMEELRPSEGLVAMFGLSVKLQPVSNGMRIEIMDGTESLGSVSIVYLDESAIVHPPVVEPNYRSCGLEDGLRAAAVRMLHGHPVSWVELR